MSAVMRSHRGAGLVELLVALVLAALLAAAAAAALAGAERHVRRAGTASESGRALREAEQVLQAELRAASADSIRLRGDTAVEFLGLVGTTVACVAAESVLVFPPATVAAGVPYSLWRATPEPGDLVVALDTVLTLAWRTAPVDSVAQRPDGAGCVPASGLLARADSASRAPAMRIRLVTPLAGRVEMGAPVRVLRRGRYVLTRGSTGEWALSYRRCSAPVVCGTSQPVAGPLASHPDSGLVFVFQATESRLEIALRAPGGEPGQPRESRRLRIALRNRAVALP